MPKIVAIDFGAKRTGIAHTDDAQIIASSLDTIETEKLMDFFKKYLSQNQVETLVVGKPTDLKGNLSPIENEILQFLEKFSQEFPHIKIVRVDERFTSKLASYYISQSGKNKKQRQEKSLIDKVSATIILQNFLDQKIL